MGPEVNGHHHNNLPVAHRSEEVHEILSKMPHWIITNGITVLLVIILLLFTGAYFIRYPDIVVTRVTITSSDPPVRLIAQTNGKIQKIFVSNNQSLQAGDPIYMLENTANAQDVAVLKNIMQSLDSVLQWDVKKIDQFVLPAGLNTGTMQTAYSELYRSLNQYQFESKNRFSQKRISQLNDQAGYYTHLNKELSSRQQMLDTKLEIEKRKLAADSALAREKVIAPLEMDNSRQQYLDRKLATDAIRSDLIQNQLQKTEIEKRITEISQLEIELRNELLQNLTEALTKLKTIYSEWQQKYMVVTPIGGKVVFFRFWKENQYVLNGDAVAMVVPSGKDFVVKASLPVGGSGKVKQGQMAKIKLTEYPYQEFGIIEGSVEHISATALDSMYSVELRLKNTMTTTMNKKLPDQAQYYGTADILTNNKSILDRIFERVIAAQR